MFEEDKLTTPKLTKMDRINYTIDSREKNQLSKGGKIFHYCFGIFLIIAGIIGYFKAPGHQNGSFALHTILIITGITWIVKGWMGKVFFIAPKRYFTLNDKQIIIKLPNKREILYPAESIMNIKINASQIDIGLKDTIKSHGLKWITYSEYQELKDKLGLFCDVNTIRME